MVEGVDDWAQVTDHVTAQRPLPVTDTCHESRHVTRDPDPPLLPEHVAHVVPLLHVLPLVVSVAVLLVGEGDSVHIVHGAAGVAAEPLPAAHLHTNMSSLITYTQTCKRCYVSLLSAHCPLTLVK